MNLLKNITVTIPKENLQEMIEKQLKEEGFTVKSIEFQVEKMYQGYGMSEHEVSVFTNVICKVETNE